MKLVWEFKFTILFALILVVSFILAGTGCSSKEEHQGTTIPNYKPQHSVGTCLAPNREVRHNYTYESYYKIMEVQGSEYLQSAWAGKTWSNPVWYTAQYMDANFEPEKCPDSQ